MRCFASPRTWYVSLLTGCTLCMVGYPAVAQGTWYTSKAAWLTAVTSVRTDTFSDSLGRGRVLNRLGGDVQIWETGATGNCLDQLAKVKLRILSKTNGIESST